MTAATIKIIEAVERLNMTGEIGDGVVARLHELAALARLEQVEVSPRMRSFMLVESVSGKVHAALVTGAGWKVADANKLVRGELAVIAVDAPYPGLDSPHAD